MVWRATSYRKDPTKKLDFDLDVWAAAAVALVSVGLAMEATVRMRRCGTKDRR
jgi:hypothetical protein